MSAYLEKGLSLVERKKLQWAREREELASLGANWAKETQLYEKQFSARNAQKPPIQRGTDRRDSTSSSRRPSLPPLCKNPNFTYSSQEKFDREMGGETSGYGSDNPANSPEHFQATSWNHSLGYESSSSSREDRLKWGDRGMHVGKFWEPKEVGDFGKASDTPGWVKRGLERNTELVVSNTSPAESPEQDYADRERLCTGSSFTQCRTYIRGQNVPVEPSELAERERRRQIALAHQEAIRQQLEEREQKRREERERKQREEQEEEQRIAREREVERRRKEREQQIAFEKQERERKRKEALKEALELAEKEAREQKIKMKAKQNNNLNENVMEKEKSSPRELKIIDNVGGESKRNESKDNNELKENNSNVLSNEVGGKDSSNNIVKDIVKDINGNNAHTKQEENNAANSYNKFSAEKIQRDNNFSNEEEMRGNGEKRDDFVRMNNERNHGQINGDRLNVPQQELPHVNLDHFPLLAQNALVLQSPVEAFQNMQFAVLVPSVPNGTPRALPIAVPLAISQDQVLSSRTENRILTPSQYRNRRLCDNSTQTEAGDFKMEEREKYVREKMTNLEIYECRSRKERRCRTEERSVEERPKWGANRPPTRYLKQSEKDPLYQRRKLRQKMRQIKYDEKGVPYSAHSSDESQTASPRTYRRRGYVEKRGRALWRKNEQMFAQNLRVYQTEIMPLESDRDQIYYKTKSGRDCCCSCRCSDKHKYSDHVKVVDILKIEHSPRESSGKSELLELPQCRNASFDSGGESMEKLTALHNGLMLKQDQWETTRTPSLCSPRRNSENFGSMDDFLGKKKDATPALDFSKTTVNSKEEFRRLYDKIPDFKMKQEKIRPEDVKLREKNFKFKTSKKDYKSMRETYKFMDPVPSEMKKMNIQDLAEVPIDWRMLTTLRPKTKLDEDFFTRMVELCRSEMETKIEDKKERTIDPQTRKLKNKAGVVEMRVIACSDCGEDFCNGSACGQFTYDCFSRIQDLPSKTAQKSPTAEAKGAKKKKKKKVRKSRSKSKSKRSRSKSKSPKKEA